MTITVIGLFVVAIGLLLLLTASTAEMLCFVLICTLFHGSATFILASLGNVSIQPSVLACVFFTVRCLAPAHGQRRLLGESLSRNGFLILFVCYGALSAYLLPRVFAGAMEVVPLRPVIGVGGITTVPLQFSTQNITTSAYLLMTLFGAICAYVAAASTKSTRTIARTICFLGLVHVAFGWLGILTSGTGADVLLKFFRNGNYMQLDQSFDGLLRITGISPEPSIYSSYAFMLFVFTTELWLRDVNRPWAGRAALALFFTLMLSTSTTAYVGIVAYGAILMLRMASTIDSVSVRKIIVVGLIIACMAVGGLALLIEKPQIIDKIAHILSSTTVNKMDSESGVARLFWAKQGLSAFMISDGLGVGVGSFRSSSIITAILGSVGVIGAVAFVIYLGRVFKPLARSTYMSAGDLQADVGAAAAWVTFATLIPASVSSPSPDPGLAWGLFAGISLALRKSALRPEVVAHQAYVKNL